jgi:DNA invertase Pin-like site-specific DNA recombinase
MKSDRKVRISIYSRVSTSDRGQDPENQLQQLRAYAKRQGWETVSTFTDYASGKRSDNRQQFQAMMSAASRREFDVVLVWALDRFSREGVQETFEHIRTLKNYGVGFESFTEAHFRTTGPAGELMLAIAAWIAQQERDRISERVKAGVERARKAGKQIGRPCRIVDRYKVRELRSQGMSFKRIADQLGISTMTAYRILAA